VNGNLSFSRNGTSFGFALENNEKLKEGGFYLIVMLFDLNDVVEIIQPGTEDDPKIEELKIEESPS